MPHPPPGEQPRAACEATYNITSQRPDVQLNYASVSQSASQLSCL
eukprot:CAMPEP_0204191262 /NCGR_PEP_ID=MMETSP0361-20130328/59958_1 /ASSEMBLY_ACC=CAM_ASM_000343 /TAXON_ID=268821 /ORGANISM="Scrippsiella Hangoei, Strain SHTV-5" /LENGTH=44 /DNA_ID= /DNA_START= /DNA_END= /DNA_ORIENTATION=